MKRTKHKLITSIATLFICFAMLIGSTYAWFTDTASTGVNRIQAGNLDIEVLHSNAYVTTSESIEGVQNMFLNSLGDEMNWEPGAVSYETIAVSNKGNLALKYSLTFNVNSYNTVIGENGTDTGKSLLDVLKVIVLDTPMDTVTRESVAGLDWSQASTLSSFAKANRKLYPSTDTEEGHNDKESFQLIVYWPESSNDNDYNLQNGKYASDSDSSNVGNLFIKMGINVNATQLESEYDSFDQNYDKDALLPVVSITDAVKEGNNYIIGNGTYTNSSGNEVEVPKTVISDTTSFYATHDSVDAIAQEASGSLSRKLETTLNEDNNTVNINVTYNYTTATTSTEVKKFSSVVENVADIEKNLEIDKVMHDGDELNALSSKPTTIIDDLDQKYYYDATEGLLYFYSKTYSDFEVTYIRYWINYAADQYSNINTSEKTITISNAEQLALLAKNVNSGTTYKGYTVTLKNDIDLSGKRWTPIGTSGKSFNGTFDGNGHTISNLIVYGTTDNNSLNNYHGLFGNLNSPAIIKNFTINNANVSGSLYVGAVAGMAYTGKEISNVKVTGDVKISGWWYVGGIAGNGYINAVSNCVVDANSGSFVKGTGSYIGGIYGFRGEGGQTIESCTSNIDVEGYSYVGGISGMLHYGNTISNCVSSGTVTKTAPSDTTDLSDIYGIGGIAGIYVYDANAKCTITECIFEGVLNSNSEIVNGGIIGYSRDGEQEKNLIVINCSYSGDGVNIDTTIEQE